MSLAAETRERIRYVETEITYLEEQGFPNRRFAAPGEERNTGRYKPYKVKIGDARAIREEFTLDRTGFVLLDHKSAVKNFFDNDEVARIYPSEVEAAIKRATGANRVVLQGWMVRSSGDQKSYRREAGPYRHHGGVQPPAGEAHVDYLPAHADRFARATYEKNFPNGPGFKRFIATSFWRAFSEPPQDTPLALCDGRSIGAEEGVGNVLIVCDKIPDEAGMRAPMENEDKLPTAAVFRYNPAHRWWYFPNMTQGEALLFKFHDSDRSVAWRCMHTAFRDPSFPNAHIRESIEFRSLAYFE